VTTEQFTGAPSDTAESADRGLLIAVLVMVLLGVAGMLLMS